MGKLSFTFLFHPKRPVSLIFNTCFLLLLSLYITISFFSQSKDSIILVSDQYHNLLAPNPDNCNGVHKFPDRNSRCAYVKSNSGCRGKGYINYLEIFYCSLEKLPLLGNFLLLLWLVLLFYLLGNTASEYFVPSVESLSRVLKLSPTIAGTTLLPLGNGANDVFSSIISFTRSTDGEVGLNSILGGSFFVSCFVVGIISILIPSSQQTLIDRPSFIRDVFFFLFTLATLLMIIFFGRVNIYIALCFTCIYFVYICTVSAMHFIVYSKKERVVNPPTIPSSATRHFFGQSSDESSDEMDVPLLGCVDEEKNIVNIALEHHGCSKGPRDEKRKRFCNLGTSQHCSICFGHLIKLLEMPLYLPRRVTIPMVKEENWSKPFAVCSATFAPILLATLWTTQKHEVNGKTSLAIYMTACLVGVILGNLAFVFTKTSSPPKRCLFPWLGGGFLMSITWTYLIAEELVSLLVSLGTIAGIDPSILGLTVLAWGNSIGDLISNGAMALNGGPDGAQIAISGCYAGPLFNTLIGLGLSLVFASWNEYPSFYALPMDSDLYETIGFLIGGLLWAVVILPKRNMRLDRFLGSGLLAIYFCFLFLRIARMLLNGSFSQR